MKSVSYSHFTRNKTLAAQQKNINSNNMWYTFPCKALVVGLKYKRTMYIIYVSKQQQI